MRAITAAIYVAMFLFLSSLSGPAQAYLDPGTGSLVIQLVLGGIVAALTMVKLYWHKLKALVWRKDLTNDLADD